MIKKRVATVIKLNGTIGGTSLDDTTKIFMKRDEFAKYLSDKKFNVYDHTYNKRFTVDSGPLVEMLKKQKMFSELQDIITVEYFPAIWFDKFGYKINLVFVTGKEMDLDTFSKLIPMSNKYAIYFAKYRCPMGDCLLYDENKDLTIDDMSKLKKIGDINIINIPRKMNTSNNKKKENKTR